jgi:hypothetical protein
MTPLWFWAEPDHSRSVLGHIFGLIQYQPRMIDLAPLYGTTGELILLLGPLGRVHD